MSKTEPIRLAALILAGLLLAWCGSDERGSAEPGTASLRERFPDLRLDSQPREILPGVYSLGEFFPVQLYAVRSDDGLVLIDTGFRRTRSAVEQALAELELDPAEVRHILLTHLHLDHWMAAGDLAARARIYAGRADAERLTRGAAWHEVMPSRLRPDGFKVPRLAVDVPLEGDLDLSIPGLRIRALATPGHTPGSTCYLLERDGQRILFSGDTVMSVGADVGTYAARLHPRFLGDLDSYVQSLEKLGALDLDALLPGHPYFDRQSGADRGPSPFPTREEWRAQVQRGLDDLALTRQRFERDGRPYLGAEALAIGDSLYCVGMLGERTRYAVVGPEGVVLVDPGPAEAWDELARRLLEFGHPLSAIRAALFTRARAEDAALLERLLEETTADILRSAPFPEALAPGSPRLIQVAAPESRDVAGLSFEVIATPALSADSVTWLVKVDARLAAFTGDALRPLSVDGELVPWAPAQTPADSRATATAFEALARKPVKVWLPSHPFASQNACLYDYDWAGILRANRGELLEKPRRGGPR